MPFLDAIYERLADRLMMDMLMALIEVIGDGLCTFVRILFNELMDFADDPIGLCGV